MRRLAAVLLLCCLLPALAFAELETPDAMRPIQGLRRLSAVGEDGERVAWEASLSLTDYLGVDKAARQMLNELLAGLSARYEVQGDASGTREALVVNGGAEPLLSLTRWLREEEEWLLSPQLESALTAQAGSGLLTAFLGEGAQYWPQEAVASSEPLPEWTRVRAGLTPSGSPEEGYACLLEGDAGMEATLALLGMLRLEAPDAPFWWLPIPTALVTDQPVSIFWMEDAEGTLTQARLAASFAVGEGEPWVLSLSLKRSFPKNGDKWELSGQASQGEDLLEGTWSSSATLSGKQIKRQVRLKLAGTLAGAPLSLDMRQNDTNTFVLSEEGLAEKLTRSLDITSSYKSETAIAQGWNALSLTGKEKSDLLTTEDAVQYSGTLEAELQNGSEGILAGTLTFSADTLSPAAWVGPAPVQRVDPQDEAQQEELAAQGQALLQRALTEWMRGLPAETLQLLLL